MSTIINGTSSAITFPDSSVQTTAFTTGAVTQATIGTNVAGTGPAFSATLSSVFTPSINTWTKVTFNTESFDTANAYDNATNYRFTPLVAGYYQVNIILASNGVTAYVIAAIYKNGSQAINSSASSASGNAAVLPYIIYMNGSTDYIESYVYMSGAALGAGSSSSTFQACLVRAA